jgi:UDPglucose 6-dehydrogenase
VGIDIDKKKIKQIQAGEMPIYEPGLSELVLENVKQGRLKFNTSLKEGIKDAEIIFICVGTPQGEDGSADLKAVWAVAQEIGENLSSRYTVVVIKSTVPVGTNDRAKEIIEKASGGKADFDIVSNPEFLREGSSIEDMQNTDRTVIGSDSKKALKVMRNLYDHLNSPILECDLRSSELIKYASNAFLATKISFINEMGQLCERAGADVETVAKGMGLDKRIGPYFLNAGIGYGGSCFPKDVAALYKTSTDQAYDFKLIRGVMEVNDLQKDYFIKKVTTYFGDNLSGRTFACLGLAFKGNTDDIRYSVSVEIVKMLRGLGAKLRVYDPEAMENAKKKLGEESITYCKDLYQTMEKSDALFLLTEWNEFSGLDLKKIKSMLKQAVIFDGRNLLIKNEVEKAGFTYFAIGKKTNGLTEEEERPTYAILRDGTE